MSKNYEGNMQQLSRMVHEILSATLKNELDEISDKYNIPIDKVEKMAISLYVKDASKSQWKSTKSKFVKIFDKETKLLLEKGVINWQELGFLTFLALQFTTYEDNCLRNEDGSLCTQKDIISKSISTKPTVSRMMVSLVKKRILFEKPHDNVKNGKKYFISPYLFYRGRLMSNDLKTKLNEAHSVITNLWKNYHNENESIDDLEINEEFDTDEFITMLEEMIVDECYNDQYSTVTV